MTTKTTIRESGSIYLSNEKLRKPEPILTEQTIDLSNLPGDNELRFLLNVPNLDTSKSLAAQTWTYEAYDWVSDNGVLVAREGECKITLLHLPIINSPHFRLYSTYFSNITSEGYKTRPYRGGRNPRPAGYLKIDIDFLTPEGGFVDGWEFTFDLGCTDSNKEVEMRSGNFSPDFYSEISTAPNCGVSFARVVKC